MSVLTKREVRLTHKKPHAGVAFYDLDGTLCALNLVHSALFILANLGEWSGRAGYLLSFAARAPRLYLAERKDRRLLNQVLFESFQGISADRLFSLGEEYCARVLVKNLYPRAVEILAANREVGLEPVLVTGSPDFIAEPLARHLGVSHVAANRLVMSRGHATGAIAAPVMAAEEKAAWCAQFAADRGLALGACWGYADSYYDLPFLAALGHPVAVNPDRKLRAAALGRQWPIITFDKSREFAAATDGDRALEVSGGTIDGAS